MWSMIVVTLLVAVAQASEDCRPKITVPGAIPMSSAPPRVSRYHVPDNTSEIYCTSNSTDRLIFVHPYGRRETVNATTIKASMNRGQSGTLVKCASSMYCADYAVFFFSRNPNITDFHCFSINFETLNCSWSSNSRENNYTLSLAPSEDSLAPICSGEIGFRDFYSCLWDLTGIRSSSDVSNMFLRLKLCNVFKCVDQTTSVNIWTKAKLAAPKIKETEIDGTDVVLKWEIPFNEPLWHRVEINYKIEYWFSSMEPRVIAGTTEGWLFSADVTNRFKLPCPDRSYSVRVSARPAGADLGLTSSSDFGSISAGPSSEASDPVCDLPSEDQQLTDQAELLRKCVGAELKECKMLKKWLKNNAAMIEMLQSEDPQNEDEDLDREDRSKNTGRQRK